MDVAATTEGIRAQAAPRTLADGRGVLSVSADSASRVDSFRSATFVPPVQSQNGNQRFDNEDTGASAHLQQIVNILGAQPHNIEACLPVFASLSDDELRTILDGSKPQLFKDGQIINDPPGGVLVTTHGTVSCFLRDLTGEKIQLPNLETGSLIGEKKYLLNLDVQRNSTDANIELIAEGMVRALVIPHSLFQSILGPKAYGEILRQEATRVDNMNKIALAQMVTMERAPGLPPAKQLSDRLADRMTTFLGSWKAIAGFYGISALWIAGHQLGAVRFDTYPYIFLNLVFSMLSAGSAFVILKSQNRQNDVQRQLETSDRRLLVAILRRLDEFPGDGRKQDESNKSNV